MDKGLDLMMDSKNKFQFDLRGVIQINTSEQTFKDFIPEEINTKMYNKNKS